MGVANKYAPQSLDDVIYSSKALEARIKAYRRGIIDGHMILQGPNGTGKSTIARLLPHDIVNGSATIEDKDYDDLLNQKDLKGYLKNLCSMNRLSVQNKVFLVFEEFDNAKVNLDKLWTAMDVCSNEMQVIISTNHPMKIHKSIRSRCDNIFVDKLTAAQVLPRAQFILQNEGLNLPDEYVLAYLQTADWRGDLRQYMRMLDDLLALQAMTMPLPAVNSRFAANQASFRVVSGGSK